MTSSRPSSGADRRPWLIFFSSKTSGRCRRVEAYLAQVLQRRHNHRTFRIFRVELEDRPDRFARFGVAEPAVVVVEGRRVRGQLDNAAGAAEIEETLQPWLNR